MRPAGYRRRTIDQLSALVASLQHTLHAAAADAAAASFTLSGQSRLTNWCRQISIFIYQITSKYDEVIKKGEKGNINMKETKLNLS